MKKCCIDDGLSLQRRRLKKAGLIMRLTLFLTITFVVNLYASTYSQNTKLNLNYQDIQLKQLFEKISEQSEFRFIYNNNVVNDDIHVSVKAQDAKIETILNNILGNAQLGYRIVDKHVIVFPSSEETSPALNTGTATQKLGITGKVTDEHGDPLPGVSISVKGTTLGTITDANGNYTIQVPSGNSVLSFSFIGMIGQEIKVEGKNVINVNLKQETVGIEEVVAIGYGNARKQDLSGAIATTKVSDVMKSSGSSLGAILQGQMPGLTIASSDVMKSSGSSLGAILQGQMPGLTIASTGGDPGASNSISIRGLGNRNGDAILTVVDGIPGAAYNLEDVESVTVLKDGATAAIYGATAGSGGVVLITTKKAKVRENKS